jgi:hypothetical protein
MLVYFFFGRVFDSIGGDWVKIYTKSPPISKPLSGGNAGGIPLYQGLTEMKVQQEKVLFRN